ncbi:MAG: AAA family ATPase [Candidatus Liptonbacteria bacterium]|nr:AAA family ATPase [Candidatus Liptonbacteria bacterium]
MTDTVELDTSRISDRAMDFKIFLEKEYVGQERAVKRLVQAYDFALSPIRDTTKPIFIGPCFGPSGVGKSFLARCVAKYFFEDPSALTFIDCTKLTQGHEVSVLTGAPPGYLGYDNKNDASRRNPPKLAQEKIDKHAADCLQKHLARKKELQALQEKLDELKKLHDFTAAEKPIASAGNVNQKLRNIMDLMEETEELYTTVARKLSREILRKTDGKFFSVILFDEFEKAHSNLHDNIMTIGDTGQLVLMNDQITSFENSFVFLTSNLGSKAMDKLQRGGSKSIGFGSSSKQSAKDEIYAAVVGEMKNYFKTEFLGRLQRDIIVFRPLRSAEMEEILKRFLEKIGFDLLIKIGAHLTIGYDVKTYILEDAAEHPEYGARPLEQAVDHLLQKPMARLVSSGQVGKSDEVSAHMREGKIVFTKTAKPPNKSTSLIKVAKFIEDQPPFEEI